MTHEKGAGHIGPTGVMILSLSMKMSRLGDCGEKEFAGGGAGVELINVGLKAGLGHKKQ
ncbi:MAG: hypothetical protein KBC57_11755 [Neisseriaceae bacterium]|nr:hypothetical protein [Neisseriaceae bacterium]